MKIGVAGTHSTGKSTFLARLTRRLTDAGLAVSGIGDLATEARDRGFPILDAHTFESTLWIMAEGMRREMEASLHYEVVLVDRPVPDALGYLHAALRVTGRAIDPARLLRLQSIAEAHVGEYDLILVTKLDPSVPVGEGRDDNDVFRQAAADEVETLLRGIAPTNWELRQDNQDLLFEQVIAHALAYTGKTA